MAGDHQLSFVGTIQAVAELPGELTRGPPAALAASSSWDAEPRGVPADPGSDRWRVLTEWVTACPIVPAGSNERPGRARCPVWGKKGGWRGADASPQPT
jgi:hypothetical protein